MAENKGRRRLGIAAVVAVVFGLLTILSGGKALFGGEETKTALGAVVPFVLWFNFCAGFAYVTAGVGLWLHRRWARWLSLAVCLASAVVLALLVRHILGGGAYEMRTLAAMSLRTGVWAVIARLAWTGLNRAPATAPD